MLDHVSVKSVYEYVRENIGFEVEFACDFGGSHSLHGDLAIRMGDPSPTAADAVKEALSRLHRNHKVMRVLQRTLRIIRDVDPESLPNDNLLVRPEHDDDPAGAELEQLRAQVTELTSANGQLRTELTAANLELAELRPLRANVLELEEAMQAAQAAVDEAQELAIRADDQARESVQQAERWRQLAQGHDQELEAQRIQYEAALNPRRLI